MAAIAHQFCHGIDCWPCLFLSIILFHLVIFEGGGGKRLDGEIWIDLITLECRTRFGPFPVVHDLCHGGGHATGKASHLCMVSRLVVVYELAVGAHVVIRFNLIPRGLDQGGDGGRPLCVGIAHHRHQRCAQSLDLAGIAVEPPFHVLGQIVGVEAANDVAVLKIDAEGLTPASLGNSDTIRVGDIIYAVGNPLGELEFSMSTGHVSAKDRVITTQESESINMFQIDAAVNEGNSGGPVFDTNGNVIGIVTAKYSDTGVEGLGFAIPINDIKAIADDLINKGYVTGKAYMGVSIETRYNAMYSQYYGMPLGAYIENVTVGSAAETAGLQKGDIITAMGEYTVEDYSDLKTALRHFSAFDTTELTVYRAGEELHLSITFDEEKPE